MAEYALILVLIAVAIIVALSAVGGQLSGLYDFINEGIAAATG
jgi:Flp pilus assembly pilin Flp